MNACALWLPVRARAHLGAHLAAPCPLPRVTELVALSAEAEESSHFVIGAVLYRTLGLILPPPR